MGFSLKTRNISGGAFSDWVSGTTVYNVPVGYEAYSFIPGGGGATIDYAYWLVGPDGRNNTSTIVADAYKSKWIDQSVTTGVINFINPVVSIALSAGTGLIYCVKSQVRMLATSGVPANALLGEDGLPILNEDGSYILIE